MNGKVIGLPKACPEARSQGRISLEEVNSKRTEGDKINLLSDCRPAYWLHTFPLQLEVLPKPTAVFQLGKKDRTPSKIRELCS